MTTPTLSLQRASCGCIGLPTSEFYLLVLQACDGDPDTVFYLREMREKTFTPVDQAIAAELVARVQNLLVDGHRWRELRRLLAEGGVR